MEFLLAEDARHVERLSRLETLVDKLAANQIKLDDVVSKLADSHLVKVKRKVAV